MRMQLDGNDFRSGIAGRQRRCLAARSGAAIEHARSCSQQCGDQLRSFILEEDASVREARVSALCPRRSQRECWQAELRAQAGPPRRPALARSADCRVGARCWEHAGHVCRWPKYSRLQTLPPISLPATQDAHTHTPGMKPDRPRCVSGAGSTSTPAILRSTALANGAADRFCARFTNSTLSLIAARAGTRVRNCIW